MTIPRPEYPRPQFAREDWLCLNGRWQFEIDAGDSGEARGLRTGELQDEILVPFCPESSLSGVGQTDFLNAVWYRRVVDIPAEWAGRDVLLHFQAVDYETTVWVNNREVSRHRGGHSPFCCDLTGIASPGEQAVIVVRARDNDRVGKPKGKQSPRYENFGCHYTRTTGIWQTVWMEPVPKVRMHRPRITPDVTNRRFLLQVPMTNSRPDVTLHVGLHDEAGEITAVCLPADGDFTPQVLLEIPEDRVRLWQPGDGQLYDIRLELRDAQGATLDRAETYAGLRSVIIDGKAIRINGRAVFQRLVLDQGFYPDGIMTAPCDEALQEDIRLSLRAGFNGARLHQKVFEERFLYHADRMGYLVWGEFPDWGFPGNPLDPDRSPDTATYITQWLEVLHRDYSHPSIVGWCPMNETPPFPLEDFSQLDDVQRGMFLATKAMDTTRPVLDASGWAHRVRETDIYDDHSYQQDAEALRAEYAETLGPDLRPQPSGKWGPETPCSLPYQGQPFFLSEFGGTWWNAEKAKQAEAEGSWGYGNRPRTVEEVYRRFETLTRVLLEDDRMFGYCYTQLTDVFQEQNGVYHFDRSPKLDPARLATAQQIRAAIETKSFPRP